MTKHTPGWFIESRGKRAKHWRRHIPGFWSKESAEIRLEDHRFHGRLNPRREYRIAHIAKATV